MKILDFPNLNLNGEFELLDINELITKKQKGIIAYRLTGVSEVEAISKGDFLFVNPKISPKLNDVVCFRSADQTNCVSIYRKNITSLLGVVVAYLCLKPKAEIVDFIPQGKKRIYWDSPETKGIGVVTVNGDSLVNVGINDSDELIVQTIYEKNELKNGQLIIAEIVTGMVVKFFHRVGEYIILSSANPNYQPLIFNHKLVKIKGIVLRSVKIWKS